MKYGLLLFILLSSFPLWAQDTSYKTPTEDGVSAKDSAKYYYGNKTDVDASADDEAASTDNNRKTTATTFKVNHEPVAFHRAYRVNTAHTSQEVMNRATSFAQTINVNYEVEKTKSVKKISVPFSWHYHGGFNECIEDLDITGKILLEVKDVRTRISLVDIHYVHHDKYDGDTEPVAKRDFFSKHDDCAPEEGKIELLYNCTECQRSIQSLDKSLQNKFTEMADLYQERLK